MLKMIVVKMMKGKMMKMNKITPKLETSYMFVTIYFFFANFLINIFLFLWMGFNIIIIKNNITYLLFILSYK